jgi:hypothetical protein
MANTLGSSAVGTIVKIKENGVLKDFKIAKQNYVQSGVTAIERVLCLTSTAVFASSGNKYEGGPLDVLLTGTYRNTLDSKIRDALVKVNIPCTVGNKSTSVITISRDVFVFSGTELGMSNTYMVVEGSKVDIYSNDASRIKYSDDAPSTARDRWSRSAGSSYAADAWRVGTSGAADNYSATNAYYLAPVLTLPSALLLSSNGEIIFNQSPPTPSGITVSGTLYDNNEVVVSCVRVTDPDAGDSVSYTFERSENGENFSIFGTPSATPEAEYAVNPSSNTVQFRVKAKDDNGNESGYRTGEVITVLHNKPPEITGDHPTLGIKGEGFTYKYAVTDADSASVTVTEKLDSTVIRTYSPALGASNTASVGESLFAGLTLGAHALTITATDVQGTSSTLTVTFTKQVTKLSIQLEDPLEHDQQPMRVSVKVTRHIPPGATWKCEVTNNPFDPAPAWEDCTDAVERGFAYVFANKTSGASRFGLGIRVSADRAAATDTVWISGIGGNFE